VSDIGDKDVLRWARQVAEAMSYLHANGVVHRTLKTKNIIVDRQGNIKVKDYGLAPVKIFCEQAGAPGCPEVSQLSLSSRPLCLHTLCSPTFLHAVAVVVLVLTPLPRLVLLARAACRERR
jgi:serine/threonine protein kinase